MWTPRTHIEMSSLASMFCSTASAELSSVDRKEPESVSQLACCTQQQTRSWLKNAGRQGSTYRVVLWHGHPPHVTFTLTVTYEYLQTHTEKFNLFFKQCFWNKIFLKRNTNLRFKFSNDQKIIRPQKVMRMVFSRINSKSNNIIFNSTKCLHWNKQKYNL